MGFLDLVSFMVACFCVGIVVWWDEKHGNDFFVFLGDIFWFFFAVMLQKIGVCFDTKTDAGQLEQNWNNNKIKDMT